MSREVWRHEGLAKAQGLQPVVELYSHKSKACKQLSKLWSSKSQRRDDTLDGIYLIRVNLLEHGPKPVALLTPRLVLGVPLFVAWGPLGQVLSPREFGRFDGDAFESTLSAFFRDVAANQPFRLQRSTQSSRPFPSEDTPSEPTATNQPPNAPKQPNANVMALSRQLDTYLEKALEIAVEYLREHELPFDLTLESLVDLDEHIRDSMASSAEALPTRRALQQAAGALAVYLGETIAACTEASWSVDTSRPSLVAALRLNIAVGERRLELAPAQLVLDALGAEPRPLFGRAVELSGLIDEPRVD